MFDRVNRLSRRHLLQSAGGVALGLGVLGGAPARADENITYLFPAPPLLPAFGPIRLAQGKGYFKEAGLDVDFAVGRGGVDVAKQVGAGNAPLGGIVADAPDHGARNGVPVKIVCVFGGKGFMQLVVREDSGIEKPADLKGKTITVMSYPGHDVLCAARPAGERRPDPGRRQYPVGRPGRRLADGRHRQIGRHGRRAGLDSAGRSRRAWPSR